MENNKKVNDWDEDFQWRDGVMYDSKSEMLLYDAVKNGDIEGASEAFKDPELARIIFGEDAEDIENVEVLKKDIGRDGVLCKAYCKNKIKYYVIDGYIYYRNYWDGTDDYCAWVVIPTAG